MTLRAALSQSFFFYLSQCLAVFLRVILRGLINTGPDEHSISTQLKLNVIGHLGKVSLMVDPNLS